MEETIWEILHLDTPTSNIDDIKKAYSEQSKKCNPEENPEQFQKLYNAYKIAVSEAKRRKFEEEYNRQDIKNINKDINPDGLNITQKELETENEFDNALKDNKLNIQNREELQEEVKEKIELNEAFKNVSNNEKQVKNEHDFKYNTSNNDELTNAFDTIIENDREQFEEIHAMITKINENFGNPDELEMIVESEKFYNLMKFYDFQVNLSIYLNNRPDNRDPNYVVYMACKKFFSENQDIMAIESLVKYFEPIVNKNKAEQKNVKQANRVGKIMFYRTYNIYRNITGHSSIRLR